MAQALKPKGRGMGIYHGESLTRQAHHSPSPSTNHDPENQTTIQQGLTEITRLLEFFPPNTWPAFHVTGTNGKGSVCAYLAAMLRRAGLKTGRFTSPHLIDRWDCITIDNAPIAQPLFEQVEAELRAFNSQEGIGASNFELLTAAAYRAFTLEEVDVAVVECGMGGRYDATNVLENTVATGITSVGLDHLEHLGGSLEGIAWHKAGIMREGVPCVLAPVIDDVARQVIEQEAEDVGSHIYTAPSRLLELRNSIQATHMQSNFTLAYTMLEQWDPAVLPPASALGPLTQVCLPARFQWIDLGPLMGKPNWQLALLDGAHNPEAWKALAEHVNLTIRPSLASQQQQLHSNPAADGRPVTWIVAQSASGSKSPAQMVQTLCRHDDTVFVTEFGPVDGMPWVKPVPVHEYSVDGVQNHVGALRLCERKPLVDVLKEAAAFANGDALVIAGSLYLAGDVLRVMREAGCN